MKISFIIATVPENYKVLQSCINSLVMFKDPSIEYDFCIVPNAMTGYEPNVNKGLKMSSGDYLLFINDDVWIKEAGWEKEMLKPFTNDSSIGMVGGTNYDWHGIPSFWFVMISRQCYDKVGLLDEQFKIFSSDHDYGMRVLQAGLKIAHVNMIQWVGHQFCYTTKRLPNEKQLMEDANKVFERKWGFVNSAKTKTKFFDLHTEILGEGDSIPGVSYFTMS